MHEHNDDDVYGKNDVRNELHEHEMDKMERQLRKQALLRSKIGTSNSSSSIIYFEFISNLEQISDLALSLANTVVEVQDQRNKNIKVMG